MTRRELTELLEAAIVEWATEQRDARGDVFATARDLENIKGDPLAFSDLLDAEPAKAFISRLLRIHEDREDEAGLAALADWHRSQVFESEDGYKLRYQGNLWSDGDLEFADDGHGWPIASDGILLAGHFYFEETKGDTKR